MIAPHVSPPDTAPAPWSMAELRERLIHAEIALRGMADQSKAFTQRTRLDAKADGVRLALSYVNDCLRCGCSND